MRALTKVNAGPGLELVDRPEPTCGPLDVKVRVLRAGLCGTDLHLEPVSYTHLDVYKRQPSNSPTPIAAGRLRPAREDGEAKGASDMG